MGRVDERPSQEEDGNVGGQKYVTFGKQTIYVSSSKSNVRATVMGLTAATGEPVMCVVIYQGKEIDIDMAQGYDYLATTPFDKTKSLEENSGPGMALCGLV